MTGPSNRSMYEGKIDPVITVITDGNGRRIEITESRMRELEQISVAEAADRECLCSW